MFSDGIAEKMRRHPGTAMVIVAAHPHYLPKMN